MAAKMKSEGLSDSEILKSIYEKEDIKHGMYFYNQNQR
jgi:hypothetical protein